MTGYENGGYRKQASEKGATEEKCGTEIDG
jgi:hypothetical protein